MKGAGQELHFGSSLALIDEIIERGMKNKEVWYVDVDDVENDTNNVSKILVLWYFYKQC
jgi:hypothetical protein